jgi:hypothetical protein
MEQHKTEHEWRGNVHLTRTFLCGIHEESRWDWLVYFCTSSTWPEPWFDLEGTGDWPSQRSSETYYMPGGVMMARSPLFGRAAEPEWVKAAEERGLLPWDGK